MLLSRYVMKYTMSGTRVRITIGEDRKCYVNWIEYDEENENFLFFEPGEEVILPQEKDYQPYSPPDGNYEIIRNEDRIYREDNVCYTDKEGDLRVRFDGNRLEDIIELWFEEDYLSCEVEAGEQENYDWKLCGLQPGETEVVVLRFLDEPFCEGMRAQLTVDDNLKCHVAWTEYVEAKFNPASNDPE